MRWAISEEGQWVYAEAGEPPAHPNVEPLEKVWPAAAYMLSIFGEIAANGYARKLSESSD